jgi:hypothetical protein
MHWNPGNFQALGVLARGDLRRAHLLPLRDELDVRTRRLVAQYLDSGTTIIPLMGYSRDVIGDAFGVPGGPAIVSDGYYHWRGDAGEYVRHYGIEVDSEALEHMRRRNWTADPLPPEVVDEIDYYFAER